MVADGDVLMTSFECYNVSEDGTILCDQYTQCEKGCSNPILCDHEPVGEYCNNVARFEDGWGGTICELHIKIVKTVKPEFDPKPLEVFTACPYCEWSLCEGYEINPYYKFGLSNECCGIPTTITHYIRPKE